MDPDSAYDNFDIKPPRRGADPILIGFAVALVILLGSAGYMAWANTKAKGEARDLKEQVASLTLQLQDKEDDIKSLIVEHNAQLDRVNGDWQTRLDNLQNEHDAKLQSNYETIAKIINNSGETMNHMKTLEDKMKSGKELHDEEIAQLKAVGQGLAYLHKQYEKPLYEFQELDGYLSKQMQVQVSRPSEKTKLFKSLFSKNYRNQRDSQWEAYYRDRGRISGVKAARDKVATAYGKAQSQMSAIKLDTDQYLANLDAIVANKEANTELLESFFDVSSKVLEVHRSVMDVGSDTTPRTGTTVAP